MAPCSGRPSPDPGFGSVVELHGGHLHGPFNLISISKTLSSERITSEKAPPTLLQIQPTGSLGNKDVLEAWMIRQPSTSLQTIMTAEIVCDDEKVSCRIVRFDVFEELNGVLGIARSGTARDFLAIMDS